MCKPSSSLRKKTSRASSCRPLAASSTKTHQHWKKNFTAKMTSLLWTTTQRFLSFKCFMGHKQTIFSISSIASTRYGVPDMIRSGNGPQFGSLESEQFLSGWGVQQKTSSAHYAQGNDEAERAVQTAKNILQKPPTCTPSNTRGQIYKTILYQKSLFADDSFLVFTEKLAFASERRT